MWMRIGDWTEPSILVYIDYSIAMQSLPLRSTVTESENTATATRAMHSSGINHADYGGQEWHSAQAATFGRQVA